jgi:uncharacterized integral membrane protein
MKGLKVIPMFAVLLLLSYLGVMFVRQNPEDVIVRFGEKATSPTALGFVILTSVLAGMIFAGALCSIELMVLYMQNQRMKRKLFPRAPSTGVVSSMLGKRLAQDLNEDIDERLRDAAEPRNETTGSGQ